jgi:DNA-binding GntR family transcriptional regulator
LSENSIAAEFNVSRTPVREALKALQNEKWITIIPKIGIQVSTIEMNELKKSFNVRKALETLVITTIMDIDIPKETMDKLEYLSQKCNSPETSSAEAIEIDVEFHETLWKLCDNDILLRYLQELHYYEQRWWYYMKNANPNLKEVGDMGSLIRLCKCIKERDLDNALNVLYMHLEYYIDQLRNAFF